MNMKLKIMRITKATGTLLTQKLTILRFSSVILVTLSLTVFCSAGTVQNRPNIPLQSTTGNIGSVNKSPGRIMIPAFVNAGRTAGLEIWRIEDFEPVPYSQRDYGKFYKGDSYIILNTKQNRNNQLTWDVHFWLGSETSADEAGAAAILTVQLDDLLNGAPVQHREVQNHESALFLSYFKNGIRYENGGVGSGFRHVETNAAGQKRLFHVKGKRNVRVNQVNPSIASMNKGDCFILDAGNDIYVYIGSSAKRVEKLKAISAANQIRDQDHNGRARVQIIDEFNSDIDKQTFFDVLGSGSPEQIPEESTAQEDGVFETENERAVTLYKVSDQAGSLKVDTISQKPLTQDMLDTRDCFILDTGTGLYVWVGKGATQQEKSQSLVKAQEFLQTKKYPTWTHVNRIVEGAETAPFKQYFSTWRDVGMSHTRLIRSVQDYIDDSEEEFDMSVLHKLKKSGGKAIGFLPDNGGGKIEGIWRIEDFEMVEIPKDMYGMFYGGDSYVIKYHYQNISGGQGHIIYFWQGKESSNDEKAASAMHALRLDNELDGAAIQVRVAQYHEPRHFFKIFKGKMVTFMGGHASGFKNLNDTDTYSDDGVRLFRIRGTSEDDVRADQLLPKASKLASDDVFLVEISDKIYIWNGVGASDFEKEVALVVASRIAPNKNVEIINENIDSIPDEFSAALGGIMEYDTSTNKPGAPILEPRLFHCRIMGKRKLLVEEVHDFEQEDLDIDDIMIIDAGDEIYIWIGQGSTNEEKEKSMEMAKEYIRGDPTDRSHDNVPIVKIQQGHEPLSFKRLFPTWNDSLFVSLPTYEDFKKKVEEFNKLLNDIDS